MAEEGDLRVHAAVLLRKGHVGNRQRVVHVQVAVHEDCQHVLAFQLPVVVVGDALALVAQVLAHLRRQDVAVILLQQIADAALAALGIDPDDVGVVGAADVLGVNRQIRHRPAVKVFLLPPGHALGNGVLMGAGEGGKHQSSRVGRPLIDVHPGTLLVGLADGRHVGEVQLRVDAVGVHVHGQGDDVHIAGALAVSEERSLYPVRPGQQCQLRIRHAGSPVVVGVQRHGHMLPVFEVFAHVFHLAGIHMGHTHFHGHRQVDDDVVAFAGLQHVQNGVAHLQCVFRLGAGEALRGILEAEIALVFRRQLFDQLRAFHGDPLDLFLALAEHLLPLGDAHGIVEMDNGAGRALAGFKGLADDMLPALGQHLHRDVLGDHVVLDQGTQELILRLGGGGEAHLDLLEAQAQQQMVKFQLLFQAHGNHQTLIAVPQVNAAPLRGFFNVVFVNPFVMGAGGGVIADRVFGGIHHF